MGYGALKRACKENERDHVDDPRSVLTPFRYVLYIHISPSSMAVELADDDVLDTVLSADYLHFVVATLTLWVRVYHVKSILRAFS